MAERRGRWAWLVVVLWVALVAAAVPLALKQSDDLSGGGYDVPGSSSSVAEQTIVDGVKPDFRPTSLAGVMVRNGHGPATRANYRAALDALARAAATTKGVELNPAIHDLGLESVRQNPGKPAVIPLTVSVSELAAFDVAGELREKLGLDDGRRYGGVTLHLVGAGALWAGMLDQTKADLHKAELISVPIVAVILLIVFGSVAAALLPFALGLAAVTITGAVIYLLSTITLMNAFVTNVALMIGLGVATDYALFVVVRYREELRAGASAGDARRTAMRTSGVAVLCSGAAVIIAVASLLVVDTAAIRSLALGAIVVVGVAMLACASLLPALLRVAGRHLGTAAEPKRPSLSARFAAAALARPRRSLLASAALLALLAAPAVKLTTGDGALDQLPRGHETRVGFDAASSVTGPGKGAPLKALIPGKQYIDGTVAMLRADREVVHIGVRTATKDHKWILVIVTPRHDGDSAEAKALVERLRERLPRGSLVGGNSAAQVDFDAEVHGSMGAIVAWVLVLTGAMLTVALRSLTLGIGAVLTNLLSVGAAFGVLTAVFQWGWLDGPLGFDSPGYVDTIAVPLVFAIVFGLSMDYQVFLLTRIRERWLAGGDTAEAVAGGVGASARTITSAAVVMVAVFLTFVATGVPAIKEIGLGAAVAIAIDATIVRLVLAPAAMTLLGDRCWWLPGGRRRGAGPDEGARPSAA